MYRHILAPIDGSATSTRALEAALRFASGSGAELLALYVVDVPVIGSEAPGYDPNLVRDALFEQGARVVDEAIEKMKAAGVTGTQRVVETNPLRDDIAHTILRVAEEWPADLIVMGTHGRRGFQRLMLGSVAERFLRISCCPVLLVPASDTAAGES